VEEKKIFLSHTKKDKKLCDDFCVIASTVGIQVFRSELEKIQLPAWTTIKAEINASTALFFIGGPNLYTSQKINEPGWKYTQNWIAFEIGIACQREIDVWAINYGLMINFPMPYISNYCVTSFDFIQHEATLNYIKYILEYYKAGKHFYLPYYDEKGRSHVVVCPFDKCGAVFNFHTTLRNWKFFRCPQCLRPILSPKKFQTSK
jgi:hypothetical protein